MIHTKLYKLLNPRVSGALYLMIAIMITGSCINKKEQGGNEAAEARLVVLAPGHFHAALLQKSMYRQVDSVVDVYASPGGKPELNAYLDLIEEYNSRPDSPTHWKEQVYTGPDYVKQMLQRETAQNSIVVIAGNNRRKTDYITKAVDAGMNVLADKPMVITPEAFVQLKQDFETAEKKKVLLYDIMTERYAMTNILQKMFLHLPEVFGALEKGTPDNPAVVFKSVHHFYKEVSGKPAFRPAWYFDVSQQGEGIVDVTTHLIDLIQWECFPETVFDYTRDVRMLSARHWPTPLTLPQFSKVTGVDSFPRFLQKDIKDDRLYVYANGEMNYTLKGIHVRVAVEWKYQAPEGSGDTYYAAIRGTKAALVIRQDKAQHYKPMLYIEPVNKHDENWHAALQEGLDKIRQTYPGLNLVEKNNGLQVVIPDQYKTGHEQRFSSVIKKYLQYLKNGQMPEWETSFMLAKYYTTTQALEMAENKRGSVK